MVRFDPDGRDVRRLKVNAEKVTRQIFGGLNYETLYITTIGGPERTKQSRTGSVLSVEVKVTGVPEVRSRICWGDN